MPQAIPVSQGVGRYTQRSILDGREYIFTFHWNSRATKWAFDLADAAGVPIVSGIYVVCGIPLLNLLTDSRSPPGDIFAMDRAKTPAEEGDPGFLDFGTRVALVYYTAEELAV